MPARIGGNHPYGHRCVALSPRTLAAFGGPEAACKRLCRVSLAVEPPARRGVACWRSRAHWVEEEVPLAYDELYDRARAINEAGLSATGKPKYDGVAKDLFIAVCAAKAEYADANGRNSYPSNATIAAAAGCSPRVVSRVNRYLRLMDIATESLRGRPRTKSERHSSHRVGDKARGWTSVYDLHDRHPVDKPAGQRTRPRNLATHPRSGSVERSSLVEKNSFSGEPHEKQPTPPTTNPPSSGDRGAKRPITSHQDHLLAARWLRDTRTPRWARRCSAGSWAPLWAQLNRHRWTPQDLNDIIEQHRQHHHLGHLRNPVGFIHWLLARTDLTTPPHQARQIAREQAAAEQATRLKAQLAERETAEQARAATQQLVQTRSPGYQAFQQARAQLRRRRR